MKTFAGVLVSELVTYVLILIVVVAVAAGFYVNHQRNLRVEAAEAAIEAIKEKASVAKEAGEMLVCDNSLIEASMLENDFVGLSIVPTEFKQFDPSAGYAPGLKLVSLESTTDPDSFAVASKLYDAMWKDKKDLFREVEKDDDSVSFVVMLSESPICSGMNSQMAGDNPAPTSNANSAPSNMKSENSMSEGVSST